MKSEGGSPTPALPYSFWQGLRTPPCPLRRSAIPLTGEVVRFQNKKQGINSVVVGGIRGRTYYFRRCKKVVASNIESLPNEVLIEILVRLSTDEILEKARFVCRKWYHIIHSNAFLNAHLEFSDSNWGVLFTHIHSAMQPLFLGVGQEGRIELSKLFYKSYVPVQASCNGLVVAKSLGSMAFHLVNFATNQVFSPPPAPPYYNGRCSIGMVYALASMEYKLVLTYEPVYRTQSFSHIFTVGVDKDWRNLGVDNLSCEAKTLLFKFPVITHGFMHWTCEEEGRVLTLNAETEMFTESCAPLLPRLVDYDSGDTSPAGLQRKFRIHNFYFSTGSRLCLFSACGDWAWEVWEMEGESGEWRKLLPTIDLEDHARRVKELHYHKCFCSGFLEPMGWLKYPVLLAMHYGKSCIVYNLSTDVIDYSFELPCIYYNFNTTVHKNTLEWLR